MLSFLESFCTVTEDWINMSLEEEPFFSGGKTVKCNIFWHILYFSLLLDLLKGIADKCLEMFLCRTKGSERSECVFFPFFFSFFFYIYEPTDLPAGFMFGSQHSQHALWKRRVWNRLHALPLWWEGFVLVSFGSIERERCVYPRMLTLALSFLNKLRAHVCPALSLSLL